MPNLSDYLLPDGRYYFDNAATTRMSPEALKVYNETAERWFMNPMSYKDFDPEIENLITNARNHVADFVGGDPFNDKVIFTSGATESINLLLKGYFFANFQEKRKIVTSPIEHKAVLETCLYLESIGAELEYVDITPEGLIDYAHLESLVDSRTLFVCLMHVNNETGEISDLERIFDITKSAGSKFFTDTTQSMTKVRVDAKSFDACVGSAHKFHGPKGVGFLYIKNGINLASIQHGGKQEFELRAGTHNLPGIISMSVCLDYVSPLSLNKLNSLLNNFGLELLKADNPFIQLWYSESPQLLKDKLVYGSGSACNGGIMNQSAIYKRLFGNNANKIIRISI